MTSQIIWLMVASVRIEAITSTAGQIEHRTLREFSCHMQAFPANMALVSATGEPLIASITRLESAGPMA